FACWLLFHWNRSCRCDIRRTRSNFGNVVNPAFVLSDVKAEGEPVPDLHTREFTIVLYFEGHGHCRHVIGNGLMRNDERMVVGPEVFYSAGRIPSSSFSASVCFESFGCGSDRHGGKQPRNNAQYSRV